MVSDCIHHTAAGPEFIHASVVCVQKKEKHDSAIKMFMCQCVYEHTIQTFQNGGQSLEMLLQVSPRGTTCKWPRRAEHPCKSWFLAKDKEEKLSQFWSYSGVGNVTDRNLM